MTKVSVVGAAGTVGAAAGYNLALRDVVDDLVFVDTAVTGILQRWLQQTPS